VAYRIGIDIGGTFTDFVVVDGHGRVLLWKEDSTPEQPVRAIELGLRAVAGSARADPAGVPRDRRAFRARFDHRDQHRHPA
jgi:N-methylhydantoinase A